MLGLILANSTYTPNEPSAVYLLAVHGLYSLNNKNIIIIINLPPFEPKAMRVSYKKSKN